MMAIQAYGKRTELSGSMPDDHVGGRASGTGERRAIDAAPWNQGSNDRHAGRDDAQRREVKRFFRQVRDINRRIEREEEQLERLRARLESGRLSNLTGMPRGGDGDWTDAVDYLIDLEKRVNARIGEMCQLKRTVMGMIDAVEDSRYREVLDCYYLKGMTWEEVADAMGYSLRQVFRLHRAALEEVTLRQDVIECHD